MKKAGYRIEKHQIVPFLLTDWEVPIAKLTVTTKKPNCLVRLAFEIGWSKPHTADLGEMEIVIRESSGGGHELFRDSEMCHTNAMMSMDCDIAIPQAGTYTYYMNAVSVGRRAIINGPIYWYEASTS
ncbi:hypothetical protein DFQ01_102423 [Paenibacillus cellulosilyticus]|uniref:Uncharacterized protein n=1 Tax=Paenibacillus cellulosilyticus TaxID=375489 RepID=A0A2V2YYT4_9BACL|nr:hypothetical protein [Paenibacillus cellulosilyticus]PWW07524.1 hypothetical protein DFQ01_102423 [Paenibacillus cellulosilyticus]QKS44322.1 hypothetical protein HUB94_07785 [Paenibacillus cellulosilyticus]